MHVHAYQVQAMGPDAGERLRQVLVPDAMLAVLAPGIGLAAMAMAEPWVDAQPDTVPWRVLAQLAQHVDGACVDFDLFRDRARQGGAVQHVASQHHPRRLARHTGAGCKGAFHFPERHRIEHQPVLAHQAQYLQVGVGLLGEAYGVEWLELFYPADDGGGVVGPQG